MSRRTELSLRSFYIFNSNLAEKEGEEHKQILFYHPSDIDLDSKIKDVGLSEAIIKFTGPFTKPDGCKAVHTQKTSQVFYSPEKDIWMIMIINVPKETKQKDGAEVSDYKGGEVSDNIFRAILKQSYQMFKLFAGTFAMNFQGNNDDERAQVLRSKLELFYSKYLLTLKLPSCDIVDALRSVQYQPLDKNLFLKVHNFINMIQSTFPAITNCIFLYNEHLVWSEINPNDLYSIYEYLIGTIFPMANASELRGGSMERNYIPDCGRYGGFVTGPEEAEKSIKAPKIFLTQDGELKSYFLVTYRAMSATICLFVDSNERPNDEFYADLSSFMSPQLSLVASEIGESFTKSPASPTAGTNNDANGPKFLFINDLSLKHRGNFYLDHRRPKSSSIPTNVMNLIAELYDEKHPNSDRKSEEVLIKSINDYWIVKKTSNWRQFYVIIYNNKATLLDITAEAKKIYEQEIAKNVFFEQ